MDLFTHVIVAYLLSFGLTLGKSPVYIAAGALAGGLPDSDILLFPLATRFPLLRHHGITHSFLGVTIFAVGGGLLGPFVVPGASPLYLFLFMEVGGLSHIALDGFTNFAVPPLAPFSQKELRLDADRAVNGFTLVLSLAAFYILAGERNAVPFATWMLTGWVFMAIYGGYLLLRGVARWLAGRELRRSGYTAILPTSSPFTWVLIEEHESPHSWSTRYATYRLGRGIRERQEPLEVPSKNVPPGPVHSLSEALQQSYQPAMERSHFLAASYRYAKVSQEGERYRVHWFSLEFQVLGKAPGVLAFVDGKSGQVETRRAWFKLRGLARPAP